MSINTNGLGHDTCAPTADIPPSSGLNSGKSETPPPFDDSFVKSDYFRYLVDREARECTWKELQRIRLAFLIGIGVVTAAGFLVGYKQLWQPWDTAQTSIRGLQTDLNEKGEQLKTLRGNLATAQREAAEAKDAIEKKDAKWSAQAEQVLDDAKAKVKEAEASMTAFGKDARATAAQQADLAQSSAQSSAALAQSAAALTASADEIRKSLAEAKRQSQEAAAELAGMKGDADVLRGFRAQYEDQVKPERIVALRGSLARVRVMKSRLIRRDRDMLVQLQSPDNPDTDEIRYELKVRSEQLGHNVQLSVSGFDTFEHRNLPKVTSDELSEGDVWHIPTIPGLFIEVDSINKAHLTHSTALIHFGASAQQAERPPQVQFTKSRGEKTGTAAPRMLTTRATSEESRD
jgi:hypothetical protein